MDLGGREGRGQGEITEILAIVRCHPLLLPRFFALALVVHGVGDVLMEEREFVGVWKASKKAFGASHTDQRTIPSSCFRRVKLC